jgi:hypothetical protein|tara:strand:- start:5618 stop:6187 length:570 start_codon:yes stop_codon:yes gene_type:complete
MRALYSFIVEPLNDRRYDNIQKLDDVDLITSVSEEDHTVANRYAKVISLPLHYKGEIEIGDTLLVHHNVFKFYNDMQGRRKSGKSYFKENLFFIDDDQYFLYKHNGKWTAPGKYCFIKPLGSKDSFLKKTGKHEPLQGTIKYINNQLLALGVKENDVIIYEPESDYEFKVDGELLYRMFTNNITTILDE